MSVISGEIIEPYSQALLSVGQANNLTQQFGEEIRGLLSVIAESADLRNLLVSPVINPEVKKGVLNQILGDQVHPFMKNFLMILVDKGRILFVEEIGKQYLVLLRELNQTVLAEVTSAIELTEEQKQTVCDRVKTMTGARDVEIETALDPDLIGGVIIKVGSQVIDASLRGQLRRIGIRLNAL